MYVYVNLCVRWIDSQSLDLCRLDFHVGEFEYPCPLHFTRKPLWVNNLAGLYASKCGGWTEIQEIRILLVNLRPAATGEDTLRPQNACQSVCLERLWSRRVRRQRNVA